MLTWYLGLLGTLLGLSLDYRLLKLLKSTSGKLKSSFTFLLYAALGYLFSITSIIVLALTKTPVESIYWNITPILFVAAGTFWFISMLKLSNYFKEMKGVSK